MVLDLRLRQISSGALELVVCLIHTVEGKDIVAVGDTRISNHVVNLPGRGDCCGFLEEAGLVVPLCHITLHELGSVRMVDQRVV